MVEGFLESSFTTMCKREIFDWTNVTIPNSAGEQMVGILDDTSSADIAVLCHGFRSSKEHAVLINLASMLLQHGVSVHRFDFPGSGESEGEFQYGNYWKDAEDLRSVIIYWRERGRKVRVLIGHSKGGNAVLLYASKYMDVDLVVNVSGRFHLQRGMRKRLGKNYEEFVEKHGYIDVKDKYGNVEYRVTKRNLEDRLSTDMKSAVSLIPKHCSVLTIHGSDDEIVSCEEAKEFHKWIANHRLQILEGADHDYHQHQIALSSIVLEYLMTEGIVNSTSKRLGSFKTRPFIARL